MGRRRNTDLHGNVPDASPAVLVVVDVINDMEFEGAAGMLTRAVRMAGAIAVLKRRATEVGIPTIYVNDNFGRWRSDFRRIVTHCLEDGVRGQPVVEQVVPDDDDYFVLKPKHSGFYNTTLDLLLEHLQVDTLILTGMATDVCVLFTAADAYMRDLRVIVPRDCVTALTPVAHRDALEQMQRALKATVVTSRGIRLDRLTRARKNVGRASSAKQATTTPATATSTRARRKPKRKRS